MLGVGRKCRHGSFHHSWVVLVTLYKTKFCCTIVKQNSFLEISHQILRKVKFSYCVTMLGSALVTVYFLLFSGVSSAKIVCEMDCRNLVVPPTQCMGTFEALMRMFQGDISMLDISTTMDCNLITI